MDNLYEALAEILEVDEVKPEDELDEFENWDSLAVLEIIAMIDEKYSVVIDSKEVKNLITAADLEALIRSKI